MDCIFCQIVTGEIPANIIYQDASVIAFPDIHPQAPIHILVIPKTHVASLSEVNDYSVMPELFRVLNKLAKEKGIVL